MLKETVISIPNLQANKDIKFRVIPFTYEGGSITDFCNNLKEKLDSLWQYPSLYVFGRTDKDSKSHVYIGESNSVVTRIATHIAFNKLKPGSQLFIISGEQFDASLTYNLETKLIGYFDNMKNIDANFELDNLMLGQRPHLYGMKKNEAMIFETIYSDLETRGFIKHKRSEIESSTAFKFSPFKVLNSGQLSVMAGLKESKAQGLTLVTGLPGTGKSIIATAAMLEVYNMESVKNIALIAPTKQLLKAYIDLIKSLNLDDKVRVFTGISIVNSKIDFDYLIIDEGHRLKRDGGLQTMGTILKLIRETGEKDILLALLKRYKNMLVVYDSNQRVTDGDLVIDDHFKDFDQANKHNLTEQMRAKGASELLTNLYKALDNESTSEFKMEYDFKIFDDFSDMNDSMVQHSKNHDLVRYLAGYAFEWKSKKKENNHLPDFELDGVNLQWNKDDAKSWIMSKGAKELKEVAYFDYIQGFDLDYAGLIIGNDLDVVNGKLVVDPEHVWGSTPLKLPKSRYKGNDDEMIKDMTELVVNRYKILMSRGTKGLYLYFTNPKVKEYFKKKVLTEGE